MATKRHLTRSRVRAALVKVSLAALLLLTACINRPAAESTATAHLGERTKTADCQVNGALPDSACTPGAIISSATKEQICTPGYAKSVRDVTTTEKDQVYAEYRIKSRPRGAYEVDHLVSLELGGSNDIANLWPEAANPRPGFHQKDVVENYLHEQVCTGAISLSDAQVQIATNWLETYNRLSESTASGQATPTEIDGQP